MILPSLYETYVRVENNYCLIEPIVVYQLLIFFLAIIICFTFPWTKKTIYRRGDNKIVDIN